MLFGAVKRPPVLLTTIALTAFGLASFAGATRAVPPPSARATDPEVGAGEPRLASATRTETPPSRYLAIGGGSTPEYTEVSLEQDMLLAKQVLPGPGTMFFAGGADAVSVRSTNPLADGSTVLARLGDLFAPRAGRQSQYRRTTLSAAPATLANIDQALTRALENGKDPLLVYVAAHGEQGDRARENYVDLWGGDMLSVKRVAEIHEAHPRPLRMLVASCYSGGFGDLAFANADPARGPSRAPRCGLFAGPWDRQTSGCDPNPDRGAQEGYSVHVLHALLGQDRNGKTLPSTEIDFNGDGRIGLLEAHTRARIVSASIDVPTTTSERYLREVEHRRGNPSAAALPEDAAVVALLGKRLGLPTRAKAEQRWKELSAKLDALDERLGSADTARDRAISKLSGELLGRWPILDDPYHGEFAATVQKNGKAITAVLDSSADALELNEVDEQVEAIDAQLRELEPQEAQVLRLLRAYETLSLAASLKARGGPTYQYYRSLLECERAPL
jgi:hypothetical protein